MDIAIIDYKMSNLRSVEAACNNVGLTSIITSDWAQIMDAKIAILPGVGAFSKAMNHIIDYKLDKWIFRFIESGKPLVGICLGLQLLFDESDEFGTHNGLGLLKGKVKKFNFTREGSIKYPVPQIGWNKIKIHGNGWHNTLLGNNQDEDFMYFVHSYYVVPDDDTIILSKTKYGSLEYCSSVCQNNIFGAQFHPEKSGKTGLKIYQELKSLIRE